MATREWNALHTSSQVNNNLILQPVSTHSTLSFLGRAVSKTFSQIPVFTLTNFWRLAILCSIYIYIYVYLHIHTSVRGNMCVCIYIYIYIYIYIHTHTHKATNFGQIKAPLQNSRRQKDHVAGCTQEKARPSVAKIHNLFARAICRSEHLRPYTGYIYS